MEEQLQSSWDKLVEKLSGWVDALIVSLPNFLIAVIVFTIAYWLARNLQGWANKFLKRIIKQPSIRGLLTNILSILVIVLGLFMALGILNLDGTLKSLLAGAGVAGLAISLALQGTLSNTFSGIFIAIKDELNIGDYIETNDYAGKVMEIDLRNTKIKESDNNIVVIPNRMILDNPFKNYGLTERIRTTITCGVAYESDLKAVRDLAKSTIQEIYPPKSGENIEFFYTNFGDSSIDFLLRFWVDAVQNLTSMEVKSEAIMAIKESFQENDIDIPFPIQKLVSDDKITEKK